MHARAHTHAHVLCTCTCTNYRAVQHAHIQYVHVIHYNMAIIVKSVHVN